MSEDLRINKDILRGVKYITVRNLNNEDVKYYKEGAGGGSGENVNFRTAESEEIQAILSSTLGPQQAINENSRYRAATADEINNVINRW